jgi:hypothetical protein
MSAHFGRKSSDDPSAAWRQKLSWVRGWPGAPGLGLSAAAVLAYAPTLGYWFYFDDFWYLHASQSIPAHDYIWDAFNFRTVGPVPEFLYRPLYVVLFRGLYEVFGREAWAYHALGLGTHVVNGALIGWIAWRITRRVATANVAMFVFLLHPSYAVAVASVTNNISVFSTSAYLVSLACMLRYLDAPTRSRMWYAGAFGFYVTALFLHPETTQLVVVLTIAYMLFGPDEHRSARIAGVHLAPFIVTALLFAALLIASRSANDFQSSSFEVGPHIGENYARYAGLVLDPFRATVGPPYFPDASPITSMRAALTLSIGAGLAVWLVHGERTRPRAAVFALIWLAVAMLPLSSWNQGAYARKLYVAGPPFALMVATAGTRLWDQALRKRLVANARGASPAAWAMTAACAFAVVALAALTVRIRETAGAIGEDSKQYRLIVDTVRGEHPTIAPGSTLYVTGVPWPKLVFNDDATGLLSALQLYYPNVRIELMIDEHELETLPEPPRVRDVVVSLRCPPICQPPIVLDVAH